VGADGRFELPTPPSADGEAQRQARAAASTAAAVEAELATAKAAKEAMEEAFDEDILKKANAAARARKITDDADDSSVDDHDADGSDCDDEADGGSDEIDDGSGDDHDADGGDSLNTDNDVDGKDSSDDGDGEIIDDADDAEVDVDPWDAYFKKERANEKAYRVSVEGGVDPWDAYFKQERANEKAYRVYVEAHWDAFDDQELKRHEQCNKTYWTETRALPATSQAKPTAASSNNAEHITAINTPGPCGSAPRARRTTHSSGRATHTLPRQRRSFRLLHLRTRRAPRTSQKGMLRARSKRRGRARRACPLGSLRALRLLRRPRRRLLRPPQRLSQVHDNTTTQPRGCAHLNMMSCTQPPLLNSSGGRT
jgi:hypothetical protein